MTATLSDFTRQIRVNYATLAPASAPGAKFFQQQAQAALDAWTDLWPALLESDAADEPTSRKLGRIRNAQARAEEVVRAEYLMPPESERRETIPEDGPDEIGGLMAELRGVNDEIVLEGAELDADTLAFLREVTGRDDVSGFRVDG